MFFNNICPWQRVDIYLNRLNTETRSAVAEVLDIDNYLDWSGQVKTYLTAQDLGDIFYPNIGKCRKYFLEINFLQIKHSHGGNQFTLSFFVNHFLPYPKLMNLINLYCPPLVPNHYFIDNKFSFSIIIYWLGRWENIGK